MADPVVLIAVLTMLARVMSNAMSRALWARGVAAVVRAAGPEAAVVCRCADGAVITVLPRGGR